MADKDMGKERVRLYSTISSSISNFKEKLERQYPSASPNDPTIFFGMYHWRDYLKFMIHRGPKSVFWCGSDILNAQKRGMPSRVKLVKNYCENEVEQEMLRTMGVEAIVHPMIFDDETLYQPSWIPTKRPHFFINVHRNREKEYGLDVLARIAPLIPDVTFHVYGIDNCHFTAPNIVYHGFVPEWVFNRDIAEMQGSIRFNAFDGFAETTAKSILLGQYPITRIKYPKLYTFVDDETLINSINMVKLQQTPNPHSDFWRRKLNKPLTV